MLGGTTMQKKIPWFRVYGTTQATLESIDPAKVGAGLLLAIKYFNSNGEDKSIEDEIKDVETRIAFNTLKQGVTVSLEEYAARKEDGKRGAAAKREKMQQMEKFYQEHGGDEII